MSLGQIIEIRGVYDTRKSKEYQLEKEKERENTQNYRENILKVMWIVRFEEDKEKRNDFVITN